MLSHTSTRSAPWYVIPSDRKWFARAAASAVIVDALLQIDPQYPVVGDEVKRQLERVKYELEAEGAKGAMPHPFG